MGSNDVYGYDVDCTTDTETWTDKDGNSHSITYVKSVHLITRDFRPIKKAWFRDDTGLIKKGTES